ncbi:N-acetyl-gamma-glutamyl-phosphate reductase [Planctobacterium marinum]|uniref:N-acetyl-gamma-glutamyl-phosphate reductase n=1 Tax=Planctobacterium marinum TaxID=1631968 RepID=UPI001E3B1CCB|nr:N-acetyl-gamma-glutamyl-phosphate reductase [Planctobacterium marinum]MCC2607611.1 N-acetyl-gamma-glutamyl-phosphate reductase [Planctobacterium marinum]
MINVSLLGASGYTGMELALLVEQHPKMQLQGMYVSEHSQDAGKALWQLDSRFYQVPFTDDKLTLTALSDAVLDQVAEQSDLIFLATPHEFSHDISARLMQQGAKLLDLSGAFRIKDTAVFSQFYGFEHQQNALLQQAVYGLAEWYAEDIKQADLVAVPGCYPTASLLALKPLQAAGLIDNTVLPVINATSGVSGAGRKASMTNSLCEVSLQSYGVLSHRHQPEISSYLHNDVIFTPHLGNFKRGILATITLKLQANVTESAIQDAYQSAYGQSDIVKMLPVWPKLDQVVNSPKCHLHWQYSAQNHYIVISSAIDNLLKGAASQAMQCANLMQGWPDSLGLTQGN